MNDKIPMIIKDHVGTREPIKSGICGHVIFGTGKRQVKFTDPYGQESYYTTFDKVLYENDNIVPIGGYQFVFDKLFNIGLDDDTTLRVGDLNDESPQMKIGVPRGEYQSINYNAECSTINGTTTTNPGINISAMNYVFGFMIGDGGSREDNITAIAPDYKRRSLYRPIPFRMSNDGTAIPAGKYFGKRTTANSGVGSNSITSYFVKKFDDPKPHIVHMWAANSGESSAVVDDTVFASTSSRPIESFVEINLSVSKDDVRGYFTSTGATPRVNEIGLVTGWYNGVKDDYESIRLFTHFTRPSIILSEDDSIEAVYRLYAR